MIAFLSFALGVTVGIGATLAYAFYLGQRDRKKMPQTNTISVASLGEDNPEMALFRELEHGRA
jgi:hypothetical protein